jgi:hypothetical protein
MVHVISPKGTLASGVRGRKLELKQFLSEHGVDICLLNETHLKSDQALRFANYVCHRTDRPIRGGGTAILVRRGIDHYAVPVSGLQLEATAILLLCATRPVKLVAAAYLPLVHKTPDRMPKRRIPHLYGGRPQREAHGLEFAPP